MLTCGGFHFINALTTMEERKYIQRLFTIKHETIGGFMNITRAYINTREHLIIPRFGYFALNNFRRRKFNFSVDYINKIGEGVDIKVSWDGVLKNNQPIVFNHILGEIYTEENANRGGAGVIVNLEAGQGKTFLAMGLINHLQKKTLVITHRQTILHDWVKELKRLFRGAKIGEYYHHRKSDGDIIVGLSDSLSNDIIIIDKKRISYEDFYSQFGFIIYDEAHEFCSKSRSVLFSRASAKYMLGLSATPNERNDKLDPIAWWGIGAVLDAKTIEGYTESDIKFTGLVQRINYVGDPRFTSPIINEKLEIVSASGTLNNIIQDASRKKLICIKTKELLDMGLNVFVFADRREYLMEIMKELAAMNIESVELNENTYARLVGGANDDDIKKAELYSRVILTTYQYMGTGKSIPKMNGIILATPRKSKSRQTIGRIFRLGSNYEIRRVIVDIVDTSTIFKSQWNVRRKFYVEKGYEIKYEIKKYIDL